jgi:hypothetical protein
MIDELEAQITTIDKQLKTLSADHHHIPLQKTAPGIA